MAFPAAALRVDILVADLQQKRDTRQQQATFRTAAVRSEHNIRKRDMRQQQASFPTAAPRVDVLVADLQRTQQERGT